MYACMQLSWHQCQLKIVLLVVVHMVSTLYSHRTRILIWLGYKEPVCSHSDIPLYFPASIVLEYCAWTLSVNIANVLISSVSQIQRRIQGRGPGAQDPLSVRPNWGPKGRKKCPPTYLRVWMPPPPPLISRSRCGTEIGPVVTMSLHCVCTFLAALLIIPAFLAVIRDCMLPTLVMVVSQSETDKSQR